MTKTRSGFEAKVLKQLDEARRKYYYEGVRIKYSIDNLKYIPDLVLDSNIIVELKGYFRREAQTKMRAVREANPHLDIRFVFQKADSKIQGSKKMTCAMWADKYGFKWAEGSVPDDWFTE
jgi:hypothetical protein